MYLYRICYGGERALCVAVSIRAEHHRLKYQTWVDDCTLLNRDRQDRGPTSMKIRTYHAALEGLQPIDCV